MTKSKFCDTIIDTKYKFIKKYNMIFNTRIKKVVNLAVVGFVSGAFLVVIAGTTLNKINNRTGVGGFETPANPGLSLTKEELDLRLIEAQIMDDNLPPLTYKTYRVKPGDMIGFIAEENNITQDTLISVNNIHSTRTIQIGQYIKIPSMAGILYTVRADDETFETIAAKYEISAEKIASANGLSQDASLKAGLSLFLPDAELDWVTRQEINGDLFHRPIPKSRCYISSNYGWRNSPFDAKKRTFHGGTDMACRTGTPIYAALVGRVTFAGYNDTYGNYVIVAHHSGYKTLYGHMSKITCRVGQAVDTNSKIGEVGSTGMSTGPHLHFAVYKNGKSMNPMSLLN